MLTEARERERVARPLALYADTAAVYPLVESSLVERQKSDRIGSGRLCPLTTLIFGRLFLLHRWLPGSPGHLLPGEEARDWML